MERYRIAESTTTITIIALASALTQPVLEHFEPMGESPYLSIIESGTPCNFSYCFDSLSCNTF